MKLGLSADNISVPQKYLKYISRHLEVVWQSILIFAKFFTASDFSLMLLQLICIKYQQFGLFLAYVTRDFLRDFSVTPD